MELGKITSITMPKGITQEGINALIRFINTLNPLDFGNETYKYMPAIPYDWDYEWVNTDGKLPKRLASHYFKQYRIKLTRPVIEQIGNIAKSHMAENITYQFDFTNEFNWLSGDFGDRGSCLWGERSLARQIMSDHGVLAVRFYTTELQGFARAWFYTTEGFHLVWNGYGMAGDSTLRIAQILSRYFSLPYSVATIENNGTQTGLVYINGRGYVIGHKPPHYFDLNIECGFACYRCDNHIDEDDYHYGLDDERYCSDCFYERFDYCSRCGETSYRDDMSYIESNGSDYCERCFNRHAFICGSCGENYPIDDAHYQSGETYCEDCFERLPVTK